jgi:nitroreductase
MEFIDAVKNRRSIRAYKTDQVESEKLAFVLEAARLAPSWKNMQCWRFMVVSSEEKRQAIASTLPQSNPGTKALLEAPLVIVLCADPKESENWDNKDFYMLDAGLAMEHLLLAATDQGLATCWQGLFSEDSLRQALGIPEEIRVIAVTPLGYPGQERNPRPRKAIEEIVYTETWGESWKA